MAMIHAIAASYARRLGAAVERDEIVSCAAIGFLEAALRYRGGAASRVTYARHRALGAVRDYLRSLDPRHLRGQEKRRRAPDLQIIPDSRMSPDDYALYTTPPNQESLVMRRERKEIVGAAIDRLPPRMRAIVLDYYMGECKAREVAARHGISETYVERLLMLAREKLRRFVRRGRLRKEAVL